MIKIWKKQDGLTEIQNAEKNCWIDAINPTNAEIERLKNEFKVPEDFIYDILDIDERSRTEIEGRWLLIIMRIPVFVAKAEIPYYTVPLGVLISQHITITICLYENEISKAPALQRIKGFDLDNKHNFVLNLLFRSATFYLRYMKEVNRQTSLLEKELRKSTKNYELTTLLKAEKCLVYFITSLKSNEMLIAKLQKLKIANSPDVDEDLLEDVIIENKQAAETAKIHSDILSNLLATFASVISNNLNTVMKKLTFITIILMIPTLISSFLGMNLINFMEDSKYAFGGVLVVSAVLVIAVVYIFNKRNWL